MESGRHRSGRLSPTLTIQITGSTGEQRRTFEHDHSLRDPSRPVIWCGRTRIPSNSLIAFDRTWTAGDGAAFTDGAARIIGLSGQSLPDFMVWLVSAPRREFW